LLDSSHRFGVIVRSSRNYCENIVDPEMLSESFRAIAKEELREDENRKQQALQQFKDWIAKHPFVRNVRQGQLIDCQKFKQSSMTFFPR